MKMFFDFFPIVLFFIAYKFFGIYAATAVAMAASLIQVIVYRLKHRRFEFMHIITLIIIMALGGATILFHNEMFIKWKPTTVYWVFGLIFLATQFIGEKTLIQRLLADKISLPDFVWKRLNIGWMVFFIAMGIANLYVAYNFSTNAWVNFKLFGALGLTAVFAVAQSFYIARYMDRDKTAVKDIS